MGNSHSKRCPSKPLQSITTVVPSTSNQNIDTKEGSGHFGDVVESELKKHSTFDVDDFIHSVIDEVNLQYTIKPYFDPSIEFISASNRVPDIKMKYKFVSQLGEGASCRVMEAIDLSNDNVHAVKEMSVFHKGNTSSFINEVTLLQAMDHPNIIGLHDCFVDAAHFFIATHLCKGGSLLDLITTRKVLGEREAAGCVRDILCAVEYLHSMDIVHRDLKLKNILLTTKGPDAVLKVIDFGDGLIVDDNQVYDQFLGTIHYLSPEVIRPRRGWELKKSDLWAVGVILFVLVTGTPPFSGTSQRQILREIVSPDKSLRIRTSLSDSCRSLIVRLLCDDTTHRISAEEALKHEWISGAPTMSQSLSNSTSSRNSTASAIRSRSVEALDFDSSSSEEMVLLQIHTMTGTIQSDDIEWVDFSRFDELPVSAIMDEVGHILDHCIASGDIDADYDHQHEHDLDPEESSTEMTKQYE